MSTAAIKQKNQPIKVILIGKHGVGKSSIVHQFVNQSFLEENVPTVSVDLECKEIRLGPNETVDLQVWDTAGQEKYKCYLNVFCQGIAACILVYNITDRRSFDQLDSWLEEAKDKAPEDAIFVLVGNQSDLETRREITYEEGEDYHQNKN